MPEYYKDYLNVFDRKESNKLPLYRPFDYKCQGTDAGQVMNKNNNYEDSYDTGGACCMRQDPRELVLMGQVGRAWQGHLEP